MGKGPCSGRQKGLNVSLSALCATTGQNPVFLRGCSENSSASLINRARRRARMAALWVFAPEIGISNIAVSCSAVGSRALSKNESGNGSSAFTGRSGSGITSIIGGCGRRRGGLLRSRGYVEYGSPVWRLDINASEVRIDVQVVGYRGELPAPAFAGGKNFKEVQVGRPETIQRTYG
jgi:hypothetical protein